MKTVFYVTAFFLVINFYESNGDLPPTIKKCPKNNDLNKCLEKVIVDAQKNLASGSFGKGFETPGFEPLKLDNLKLMNGDLNVTIRNLEAFGPSKFRVESVKGDPENLVFGIHVFSPLFSYKSLYNIRIKLGVLDIRGDGDMKGNFTDIHARLRIKLKTESIGNKQLVKLDKVQTRLNIKEARFNFNNLFNGDKVLNQVGNDVINNESQEFLRRLTPELEKTMNSVYTKIINVIFKDVTPDQLFEE